MRLEGALVVAGREYMARVRSTGFWLATVALPLLLAAMMVLPTLLMMRSTSSQRIAVVDETGELADKLVEQLENQKGDFGEASDFTITIEPPERDSAAQRAELDRRALADEIDAWIWIGRDSLKDNRVEYHAESVSNFLTQERIEDGLSAVIRSWRLEGAGYDPEAINELARSVRLSTVKVTEEGGQAEGAEAGIILAYALFFLLYMVLIFYGQQVMNGVIEEKSSRIVEVIVSTVSPFQLLMGKLGGICAAALTQLAVWLGAMVIFTLPAVVGGMAWIPEDFSVPTISPAVIVHFLILFLLGFFVFSTVYAAVGSAFNSIQEAQQWAGFVVVFLIAPMFFFMLVINDPDSTLSVVTSMIPVFTPLIMMLRIAVKMPPTWQILLAYTLTIAFTVGMVWLSARVYRTGILMYGKKPTLKELWRWVRYA